MSETMTQAAPFLGERLLRISEVEVKAGVGRSTIYRRMAAETFPAAYDIGEDDGEGGVRWKLLEVEAWIASHKRRSYRGR